jgi:PAS domain-containing protein
MAFPYTPKSVDLACEIAMQRKLVNPGSWLWIALSSATVSAAVFAVREVMRQYYFQISASQTFHHLSNTLDLVMAFVLATLATGIVIHQRTAIIRVRLWATKHCRWLEEARDAIVVVDRQGHVQEWNPQAVRFFGFTRDEVLGRPLPTLPRGTQKDFLCLLEARCSRSRRCRQWGNWRPAWRTN